MAGETWDFDIPHEKSDSESTCSTSISEDSIVESRDVNSVNTRISSMSISDQLKMIREEKHQEYLLNTGCKSPSSEIPKIPKTRNGSVTARKIIFPKSWNILEKSKRPSKNHP